MVTPQVLPWPPSAHSSIAMSVEGEWTDVGHPAIDVGPPSDMVIRALAAAGNMSESSENEKTRVGMLARLEPHDMRQYFHGRSYIAARMRALANFRRWRRKIASRGPRPPTPELDTAITKTGLKAHERLLTNWDWSEEKPGIHPSYDDIKELASMNQEDWKAVCELEHRLIDDKSLFTHRNPE